MNDRSYDTPEYKATLNAGKRERRVRLASFFATYDLGLENLHEVYASGNKAGEVRGTRKMQVSLRREIRAKSDIASDQVVLYTNGIQRKRGIHKKA